MNYILEYICIIYIPACLIITFTFFVFVRHLKRLHDFITLKFFHPQNDFLAQVIVNFKDICKALDVVIVKLTC